MSKTQCCLRVETKQKCRSELRHKMVKVKTKDLSLAAYCVLLILAFAFAILALGNLLIAHKH